MTTPYDPTQISGVVITTPRFRAGQAEVRRTVTKYGRASARPNMAMLDRTDPEFRAGYLYEWREYVEPLIGTEYDTEAF